MSVSSSVLRSSRSRSLGTAMTSSATASTIDAAAAAATRRRSVTSLAIEPEADAAHGVDQRRLAELAAQVGDVAVDRVHRHLALAAPHLLERELAGDDAAGVAHEQREQLGLAARQLEVPARAARRAGVEVERDVGERELLAARRRVAAQQRPHPR